MFLGYRRIYLRHHCLLHEFSFLQLLIGLTSILIYFQINHKLSMRLSLELEYFIEDYRGKLVGGHENKIFKAQYLRNFLAKFFFLFGTFFSILLFLSKSWALNYPSVDCLHNHLNDSSTPLTHKLLAFHRTNCLLSIFFSHFN